MLALSGELARVHLMWWSCRGKKHPIHYSSPRPSSSLRVATRRSNAGMGSSRPALRKNTPLSGISVASRPMQLPHLHACEQLVLGAAARGLSRGEGSTRSSGGSRGQKRTSARSQVEPLYGSAMMWRWWPRGKGQILNTRAMRG